MEYTHVGHLGLVVSRLCLGTMNFGPHTPEPDSYSIMDSAVAYGINFFDTANVFGRHLGVGSSNFAGWHIARANEIAGWRNTLGLVSEQSPYNLMQRSVELEVIPAIQEYGMGLIAYSPLAGGLLAGALEKVNEGRRSQGYMVGEIESNRPKLDQWETLCKELGHRPADVALAWLLHQPAVTAPVIVPRTEAQLLGSMRALNIEMPEEVLGKLDEVFPGPGGPAPEAYAW